MSEPAEPAPEPAPAPPDPLKGLRGVYAAVLGLEAIAVGLSLLALPDDGPGATAAGTAVIAVIAVAMLVAAGLQRRPWGLGLALTLQVATIVAGVVLLPALAVLGLIFAGVWGAILWMRRDVMGRMARGELPAQQQQRDA